MLDQIFRSRYPKTVFLLLLVFYLPVAYSQNSGKTGFKKDQLRYSRVRTAYQQKEAVMLEKLRSAGIERERLEVFLRVFKEEEKVELWGRNKGDKKFVKIDSYDVCSSSGGPGPKRKQGDGQVPEGFYHIDRFNPSSSFYLSLGVNYPNASDRKLGNRNDPGGDIFIHGNCVTIGCLPLTNRYIKELYIYCVEARNNGQEKIKVYMYPAILDDGKIESLAQRYGADEPTILLWKELKKAQDHFSTHSTPAGYTFRSDGSCIVR